MDELTGHVALITGGNGGIGLGFGRGLAKAGARVAIWGRNADKNAAAVAELEQLGAEAAAWQVDVADEAAVKAGTAAVIERFGRIDACFANAAVAHVVPDPVSLELDDWNKVLSVNLTGVFLVFREVARHMIARGGGGRLIATSSLAGRMGLPQSPHYAATKGGVEALVKTFAVGLARHDIQANSIVPGFIETEMTEPLRGFDKLVQVTTKRTPARRWGNPADFEAAAVYLASPGSRFQTGQELVLDGGYSIF